MIDARATAPRAFVSYSWDDEEHRGWVHGFAARLRSDGVDVKLDQWDVRLGDPLPEFMEKAVRENDFVLVVCTPGYKERSDGRAGGVGFEGDIMTAEVYSKRNHRKFIPVLRKGGWSSAFPSWLSGKAGVDLRGGSYSETQYERLLDALHGKASQAPPLGHRPARGPRAGSFTSFPGDGRGGAAEAVGASRQLDESWIGYEGPTAIEHNERQDFLPPPPGLVLGREEDLRRVKRALGIPVAEAERASGVPSRNLSKRIIAMHGWPGVGKSTFLSKLCNEGEVFERFPEGVFFLTVGRSPDARRLAEEVCAMLEIPVPPGATSNILRGRIANALSQRQVLLVFDDVWEENDVSPLLLASGGSAILVGTRRLDVAARLATSSEASFKLGLLSAEESLELLRSRSPDVVEGNEEACRDLARALDGLPLALRVAADLLQMEYEGGFDVTGLLAELANTARVLEERAPADVDPGTEDGAQERSLTTVRALLQKSLERLDEDSARRFARLGVLPPKPLSFDPWAALDVWRDTAEDPDMVGAGWEEGWEREQARARSGLRELVRRGLVESAGEGTDPLAVKLQLRSKSPERFWMHALVAAFALDTLERTEGEAGVREAQQRRLEHYRRIAGAVDGGLSVGGDTQYLSAYVVHLDLPNIRAAHEWARSRHPGDRRATKYLSELLAEGARVLSERLGPEELLEWTRLAEDAARTIGNPRVLKEHRVSLGAALVRIGRTEEALPYCEEALREARASGDAQGQAAALANHAVIYEKSSRVRSQALGGLAPAVGLPTSPPQRGGSHPKEPGSSAPRPRWRAVSSCRP